MVQGYNAHGKSGAPRFSTEVDREREFFIDNLLVGILFIVVMIRWTGLAPWEFEFPFTGILTYTFLVKLTEFYQKPRLST